MFTWDESIERLDIDATHLLKLFRSMRDVQLALPGLPSQEASAYVCQSMNDASVKTVAAFYLHASRKLAFYCSTPREVNPAKAESVLYQALDFVESMGFLLSDMDIELLEGADRAMLWESLPLFVGCKEEESAETETTAAKPAGTGKTKQPASVPTADSASTRTAEAKQPSASQKNVALAEDDPGEGVDELLAAVESLRAKRPGVARRRKKPSQAEMKKRCQTFRETIGRILASL